MKRLVLLSLLLVPAAASAQDDATAKLRAAVEAAGCLVTVENGDAVQQASGLTPDQVTAAVAALYAAGEVELTPEGNMKLISGSCK